MITIDTTALKDLRKRIQNNKNQYLEYSGRLNQLSGTKESRENAKETTFLFIGNDVGDNGERPLPSGTVFWESTDIEIFKNGVEIVNNQLNEGDDFQIAVTVRNNGDMNCPNFTLELFLTDPSVGFNVQNALNIGIQRGSVNRHTFKTVIFNLKADSNYLGHKCIFARVFSTACNELPLSANGLDALNDRHVSQQNIMVIQQGQTVKMQINHAHDLGDRAILNMVLQEKISNTVLHKIKNVFAGKTMTNVAKSFDFLPVASKKTFGVKAHFEHQIPVKFQNLNDFRSNNNLEELKLPNRPGFGSEQLNKKTVSNTEKTPFDKSLPNRKTFGINRNQFHIPLEKNSFYDVNFAVPNLGLKENETSVYSITLKNPGNNVIVGGITMIVTA